KKTFFLAAAPACGGALQTFARSIGATFSTDDDKIAFALSLAASAKNPQAIIAGMSQSLGDLSRVPALAAACAQNFPKLAPSVTARIAAATPNLAAQIVASVAAVEPTLAAKSGMAGAAAALLPDAAGDIA